MRASEPQNLSFPLQMIEGDITEPQKFFVRDHFAEPDIALERWTLRVEGEVEKPFEIGFSDLVEMPTRRLTAVLECAGNVAGGSAVSNGAWEGVPMASILTEARPKSTAAFVLLEGADTGKLFSESPTLPYAQLIPLAKCLEPASLIAFKLNELALPKRNGFPARALFPGWYGMDSVKWLRRIAVLNTPEEATTFHGSGMNRVYNRIVEKAVTKVSSLQVKSAIAWPNDRQKLVAGRYVIRGFAWSGNGAVGEVKISQDGGRTWQPAAIKSSSEQYSWTPWSYSWDARPGQYVLMSRASDRHGNEQPLTRDPMRSDFYEANWCVPLHCSVL